MSAREEQRDTLFQMIGAYGYHRKRDDAAAAVEQADKIMQYLRDMGLYEWQYRADRWDAHRERERPYEERMLARRQERLAEADARRNRIPSVELADRP